jgi:WD40 repeat protein
VDREGRLLAVCLRTPAVSVWDLGSRKPAATLPHPVGCVAAAFSPDGKWLATAGFDGVTRIWSWAEGRIAHAFAADRSASIHCRPLCFSLDGERLAAGTGNGTLRMIDMREGTIKWSVRAHGEQVSAVAISPDGQIVASASCYSENVIRLWDAASGEPRGGLQGHTGWVSGLLFSPDGGTLISSCSDQTLRMWDHHQLKELAIVRGHKSAVLCEALSRDGRTLIAGEGDHVICAWDADPRAFDEEPLSSADTQMARFAPDGGLYVLRGGVVETYHPATRKLISRHEELGTSNCSIAFSRGGFWAVGDANGQISIYDPSAKRVVARLGAFDSAVAKLAFLADGSLVGTSPDCQVKRWAARTWTLSGDWSLPPHVAVEHHVFPEHNLLVTQSAGNVGTQQAEVYIWNLTTGALRRALATEQNVVAGVALSADGTMLATGAHQGSVRIWDTRSWRLIRELRAHLDGVHGVAFSPDGKRLASGSSGQEAVKIWDTATWHVLATLEGKGALLGELAFSPDGNALIATAQPARALQLWYAPSLEDIEAAASPDAAAAR